MTLVAGCREAATQPEDHGARDEAPLAIDAPCAGCTLDVPARRGDTVPLLVVLHGDDDSARARVAAWREPALARGWAVLGLQCPVALGCPKTSWYKWNGDPSWVAAQIAGIGDKLAIDRTRTFLAGWSGGATFIGMNARAWHDFVAVVIHGGGQPPASDACPARGLPAYFLVGDENPYHGAARKLRSYFEHCGADVEWDLVPGGDHAAERAALDTTRANAILDWLDRHARTIPGV